MKFPALHVRDKLTRVVVDKFREGWRLNVYCGNVLAETQVYRTKQIAMSVARAMKHVYGVSLLDQTAIKPVENVDKMGVNDAG